MLLSIVYAICLFVAAVIIIFFIAPIKLSCSGSYSESTHHAVVYFSWFHPGMLRCEINEKKHSFSIIILGRWRVFSSQEARGADQGPGPNNETAETVPQEPPIVKKPLAKGDDEKPSGHFSHGPRPVQEKPENVSQRKRDEIDKDEKEKAKGASGEKTNTPSGFLQKPTVRRVKVLLSDAAWRNKIFRWLKGSAIRFFHIASVSCFRLHVTLGLGDPCQTGRIFGYYIAAKNALTDPRGSHKEILFEPVFDREIIEADGQLELSSSIARLCLPVVLAVLTFPFLHTGILLWKSKKTGKKQ